MLTSIEAAMVPPIEEFSDMVASLQPHDLHPWGCPVSVLNKCLQGGNHNTSKYDPQAWLGVYIGHSTIYSSNVILVYNPSTTGHPMPQFHVVFDDYFQTMTANFSSLSSAMVNNLFKTLWKTSQ